MVRAQVLMKDISTEVPAAEVRELMEKCLKNAALVNYTRVSDHAKIEGTHARTPSASPPAALLRSVCDIVYLTPMNS